jgi:hypothetical protein
MAELLMRLKQFDKAEKCIAQALEVKNILALLRCNLNLDLTQAS